MDVFTEHTSDIDLYTKPGLRNGAKVAILLEELELAYRVHDIDTDKNTHMEPWFLAISPQGHVPALTDIHPDGSRVRLFESGPIMQYLVDTYDKDHRVSYPKGSPEAIEVNNWLFFQHSAVGPMHGETEHFSHRAPEKIPYSIDRYMNKTIRLYVVLDQHLAKTNTEYLVGNKCTIADIAHYPWVAGVESAGIDIERFPNLTSWQDRMTKRPAVEKGMKVRGAHDK